LKVITCGDEMRQAIRAAQQAGRTVGFVPTMGALHEGHLSLVDAARAECQCAAASIFVNPTQFGPHEDLKKYPRPLEQDLALLRARGCDLAFVPSVSEMYPPGFSASIDVGHVARPWEGAARPGHFAGVATVVLKLFQLVPADRAYFGRKDYQQTLVVQRLVEDLNVPIVVRVHPIVREPDGLAMSSRNAYLEPDERRRAVCLWQSLQLAAEAYGSGETSVAAVRTKMLAHIAAAGDVEVEYIAFVHEGTVDEVEVIDDLTVVALAARIGRTRLIDNHRLSQGNLN